MSTIDEFSLPEFTPEDTLASACAKLYTVGWPIGEWKEILADAAGIYVDGPGMWDIMGTDEDLLSLQRENLVLWQKSDDGVRAKTRSGTLNLIFSWIDDMDFASKYLRNMPDPIDRVLIHKEAHSRWRSEIQSVSNDTLKWAPTNDLDRVHSLLWRSTMYQDHFLETVINTSLARADRILNYPKNTSRRLLEIDPGLSASFCSDEDARALHDRTVEDLIKLSSYREKVLAGHNRAAVLAMMNEEEDTKGELYNITDTHLQELFRYLHETEQSSTKRGYYDPLDKRDAKTFDVVTTRLEKGTEVTDGPLIHLGLNELDQLISVE